MYVPLLGREYAYPLLQILEMKQKATFTRLLTELKISKSTLSATLQDLVKYGYVEKEIVGKYSVYRLKEKGSQELSKRIGEYSTIERISFYIYDKMREKGDLERFPESTKEEVLDTIRKQTQDIIEKIATSTAQLLSKKEDEF
jgi:Mn-dependent DtxR family transcriptional regulator